MSRLARALGASLLLLAVLAPPTAALKPFYERVEIRETAVLDEFLTEACGFDVYYDRIGHVTFHGFFTNDGEPSGEVNNFAIVTMWYSEGGSVTTANVGPDRIKYLADGSLILSTTGNIDSVSGGDGGRLYSNVGFTTFHVTFDENGEPTFELLRSPGKHQGDFVEAMCEVLA